MITRYPGQLFPIEQVTADAFISHRRSHRETVILSYQRTAFQSRMPTNIREFEGRWCDSYLGPEKAAEGFQ